MVMNTTINNNATMITIITDELLFNSMVAFLYQPDKRFASKAAAMKTPRGMPIENFRRNCFFLSLCDSQYCKNFSSSFVSIKKFPPTKQTGWEVPSRFELL